MTETNRVDQNPLLQIVKTKIEVYRAKVAEVEADLTGEQERYRALTTDFNNLGNSAKGLQDENRTLEQRCTTLGGELEQVKEEYASLQTANTGLQTKYYDLHQEYTGKLDAFAQVEKVKHDLEEANLELQVELETTKGKYIQAEEKVSELTQKGEYSQRQIDEVHAYLDSVELPVLKTKI